MLQYFSTFYFTVPVQMALNIFFIIACLMNYGKIRGMRILLLYSVIALVQCLMGVYVNVLLKYSEEREMLLEGSVNIFMIIEFGVFYIFLIKSISSKFFKKILKSVLVIFPIITCYFWISTNSFKETPSNFTVAESYLIIIPCLYYYYELFNVPPVTDILNSPNFWIITGMLLLFIILIPLFLQSNNLHLNTPNLSRIYTITFIGYITLFSFFINALKCQLRIQKQ